MFPRPSCGYQQLCRCLALSPHQPLCEPKLLGLLHISDPLHHPPAQGLDEQLNWRSSLGSVLIPLRLDVRIISVMDPVTQSRLQDQKAQLLYRVQRMRRYIKVQPSRAAMKQIPLEQQRMRLYLGSTTTFLLQIKSVTPLQKLEKHRKAR
jgi:hypothetical protein